MIGTGTVAERAFLCGGAFVLAVCTCATAAPVTDLRVQGASGETIPKVSAVAEEGAPLSIIDAALIPVEIGSTLTSQLVFDGGEYNPFQEGSAINRIPRVTLSPDAALALARLFVDPLLPHERANAAAPEVERTTWSGSIAEKSYQSAAPSGWTPNTSPEPEPSGRGSPDDSPPDTSFQRALRPVLEFLRENRQWVFAAAATLAVLAAVAGSLSRRS